MTEKIGLESLSKHWSIAATVNGLLKKFIPDRLNNSQGHSRPQSVNVDAVAKLVSSADGKPQAHWTQGKLSVTLKCLNRPAVAV